MLVGLGNGAATKDRGPNLVEAIEVAEACRLSKGEQSTQRAAAAARKRVGLIIVERCSGLASREENKGSSSV